jgi:hypothetical protein
MSDKVLCDNCNQVLKTYYPGGEISERYIKVHVSDATNSEGTEDYDFCNYECLGEWAQGKDE